jgi:hypothetical protein
MDTYTLNKTTIHRIPTKGTWRFEVFTKDGSSPKKYSVFGYQRTFTSWSQNHFWWIEDETLNTKDVSSAAATAFINEKLTVLEMPNLARGWNG